VGLSFADAAHVPTSQRTEIKELSPLFTQVIHTFGFMDEPNVPRALGM
jgi:K+ transporter